MGKISLALFLVVLVFVPSEVCRAQDPKPTPDLDKASGHGEPLPDRALARLGSVRWRHGSAVIRSAMSADGKRLATVSTRSVAVWDLATGKILFRFPTLRNQKAETYGYYSGPSILTFSPDGKKLGIAFDDEFAGIWDLENGGTFRPFAGKTLPSCHGLCRFTPDGRLFVVLYDGCIRFWDPVTGKLHHELAAPFAVSGVSADVRSYVHIDHHRKCRFTLRGFETGAIIKKFNVTAGEGDIILSPDNKTLVQVDERKKNLQVWDVPAMKVVCSFPLPGPAGADDQNRIHPYCVYFTADSKVLMLANSMGKIHRWDLATKKELPLLSTYPGEIVSLHDLPDGKTLIVTGADGLLHHFDTTTGREISDVGPYEGVPTTAVSPDSRLAAVGDSRGRVDLWTLKPLKLLRTLRSTGPRVISLAFTSDSKALAVGLESETVCFYDVASGRETRSVSFKTTDRKEEGGTALSTLLLSPDNRLLCVNSSAGELIMWDLVDNQIRWRKAGDFELGERLAAFSPDGKLLAFAAKGTEMLFLDPMTGEKRRRVKISVRRSKEFPTEWVKSLAFSPDGGNLAVALGDATIALLDSGSGEQKNRLRTESYIESNLVFGPDGQTIAAGVTESVCLWNTTTGKVACRLKGHGDWVNSIAFGPPGTLLSCGADSQVYLWSLKTKRRSHEN